jgi:HlyD family secretion protein
MEYLRYIIPAVVIVLGLLALLIKQRVVKRIFLTLFIVSLLAGLGFFGYRFQQQRMQTDPLAGGEVVEVTRGRIAEVVEATGNLAPAAETQVTFSTPGELTEILVSTGDQVREGDILARLDTTDLELQVDQAQAGVDVAQANLDKILTGPREEDITVAQSSLNQASANVEELRVTLSAATGQARLSWEQAANNLRDAQANYENIYWDNRELEDRLKRYDQELPDANVDAEAQAWRAVENAEAAMEQARLSYEQALQREETSVRSAQSQVTSSWANLERLKNSVTTEDVAVAQASLDQALIGYESALAQLNKATLTAPFDSVVATRLAEVHSQVSAATPILILVDPSSYYIDVQVDEVDISKIQVGQQVQVYLDALPEIEMPAEVTEIALSPSTVEGVITYRVRVQIKDLQEAAVRPGMTANTNIVTREAEDVLLVPRRAVRIVDGQAYVEKVLPGDALEQIPVELGLGDPFFVQITSGLEEGDRVFVPSVVQQNVIQNLFEGGPPGRP